MFYTIYQITNKETGKIYIGKHQTTNIDDGYMGSGILVKRAQEKHGLDAFSKEILHVFDSEEEMNRKEAELVNEEFCSRDDTYNLCPGGKGGWGYVNSNIPNGMLGKTQSNLQRQIASVSMTNLNKEYGNTIRELARKARKENGYNDWKIGKSASEYTKKKTFAITIWLKKFSIWFHLDYKWNRIQKD